MPTAEVVLKGGDDRPFVTSFIFKPVGTEEETTEEGERDGEVLDSSVPFEAAEAAEEEGEERFQFFLSDE